MPPSPWILLGSYFKRRDDTNAILETFQLESSGPELLNLVARVPWSTPFPYLPSRISTYLRLLSHSPTSTPPLPRTLTSIRIFPNPSPGIYR